MPSIEMVAAVAAAAVVHPVEVPARLRAVHRVAAAQASDLRLVQPIATVFTRLQVTMAASDLR